MMSITFMKTKKNDIFPLTIIAPKQVLQKSLGRSLLIIKIFRVAVRPAFYHFNSQ